MVSFVRDIPRELIGAMLVDGGTEWTVFRRLIVPLSKPVLATLSIYDGLNVWNNFILPLVLTQSNSVAVLPLGLTKLEGQYARRRHHQPTRSSRETVAGPDAPRAIRTAAITPPTRGLPCHSPNLLSERLRS